MPPMEFDPPVRPELIVELAGSGISPGEIPARDLAELLIAASQLVDAVVGDVPVALVAVESGSARYAIAAARRENDDRFAEGSGRAHAIAARRGAGSSPAARHALLKLHAVGARHGGVRVGVRGNAAVARAPFTMAPPLEVAAHSVLATTLLPGTVVGVAALRTRYQVTFKPEEGGKLELDASEALAHTAGRLFNRTARVTIRFRWDPEHDKETDGELIEIAPWTRSDFLNVVDEIRREAKDNGVVYDGTAVRRALLEEADE